MRIREILQEKGMTQKQLADKIGMSQTGLVLAMRDDGNPSLKRLKQIAEALGVPVSDLFKAPSLTEVISCPKCGTEVKVAITHVRLNAVESRVVDVDNNEKSDKTQQ